MFKLLISFSVIAMSIFSDFSECMLGQFHWTVQICPISYFVKQIKLHTQIDVHLIDLFPSGCVWWRYNQIWDVPVTILGNQTL